MSVHLFGVRHHGPGSARSLKAALEALQPDCVLVEGPPEGDALLPLITHTEMTPPVALLVYTPENLKLAAYYPFAEFSPEWVALRYALAHGVPARFIDLPQAHRLAWQPPETTDDGEADDAARAFRADPLRWLAEAAGYSDGERWWNDTFEQRRATPAETFAAVLEAMTALRQAAPTTIEPLEALREAHMRRAIRAAQKQYARVAVVCGAWHTPALRPENMPSAKSDDALLKGLPKLKAEATWVPWTHGRLTYASGYGAGVASPGWYAHLWQADDAAHVTLSWMTRVARLLRAEDLTTIATTAQIIDAARLAEALAAMRGLPLPGLPEMNEAARAVFCGGREGPMALVWQKLIVGERLGDVPDETPRVPLQRDLEAEQKRLRLRPEPETKDKVLDLREATDRARSQLLHRLDMLDIRWGELQSAGQAAGKGTFKEIWRLAWQPGLVVDLIEASAWGNTVYDAATAYARGAAESATDLPTLTGLLEGALAAALPEATAHIMAAVQARAAVAADVTALMDALPPLALVMRYGDVRQTDAASALQVTDGLLVRACLGLPDACAALDDEAAEAMFARLMNVNAAVALLPGGDFAARWQAALEQTAARPRVHGLVAGRCWRLLHDGGALPPGEAARQFGLAASRATAPGEAAAWVDGFLRGSGLLLLHDHSLWAAFEGWLVTQREETFQALLPVMRRTFASFTRPERAQMGERARRGLARTTREGVPYDAARGASALPTIAALLGSAEPAEQR